MRILTYLKKGEKLNCNHRKPDEIRPARRVALINGVRGETKMEENIKELIAIGASLAAKCQPCLTFHVNKARKLGIGEDEINEAIALGRMIQKGAISAMDRFAESVVAGPGTI